MRYLLEYTLISFSSYLILTGIFAFITDTNYRYLLCCPGQVFCFLMLYSWIPIPRMVDMDNANNNC